MKIKERGIYLKADEVTAIIGGKKTQLRRVLKTQPVWKESNNLMVSSGWAYQDPKNKFSLNSYPSEYQDRFISDLQDQLKSPYGKVGDRLWAREAWSTHAEFDGIAAKNLTTRSFHYWADGACKTGKERPSIHMPRWASRLLLEVTAIRIERLNDISKADAIKQGGPQGHPSIDKVSRGLGYSDWTRSWFAQTWDWVNKIHTWASNPWVWVIEFSVVQHDQ